MALIPQEWGPCKKRRWGHRHSQRDARVRTRGDEGRPHAQERGAAGSQPCPPLPGGRGGRNVYCSSSPICGALSWSNQANSKFLPHPGKRTHLIGAGRSATVWGLGGPSRAERAFQPLSVSHRPRDPRTQGPMERRLWETPSNPTSRNAQGHFSPVSV